MFTKSFQPPAICFLMIGLLLVGCTAAAQVTSTATSVPPTEMVQPTNTPIPTSIPTETPALVPGQATWKDIPIMPGALNGKVESDIYQFTINASIEPISTYYEMEMPKLGWEPQDLTNLQDRSHGHFTFTKENKTVIFEIFPKGSESEQSTVWIYVAQQ